MSLASAHESRWVEFLSSLGYDERHVEIRYPVWNGSTVATLEAVAFGASEPRDMTTATIVAVTEGSGTSKRDALGAARALAAPIMLIGSDQGVELWSVGAATAQERVSGPWDRMAQHGRLSADLAPHRLLAAKRAQRQLTLFPVDASLLAHSRARTADTLASRVGSAIEYVGEHLPHTDASRRSELVVGTLAALMVRDKLETGALDPVSAAGLAKLRFPSYFGWMDGLPDDEVRVFYALLNNLGADINFRSLDPAIVSDVYEHALIGATARKELSVFYTPPAVARALARATPFELVSPEERTVLDPACGSGTLLLAAQERLRGAASPKLAFDEAHRYLTEHIIGFDADHFAVEIARLSLLLNALPIGNSWRVEQREIAEGIPPDIPPVRFVMSNPPWILAWQDDGARLQAADKFVRAGLNAVCDGGFVSVLLPASLFEGRSSRATREWISERAAVVDVTRLPEDTFRTSKVETAAVVLQRSARRAFFSYRRATKREGWKARLLDRGIPDVWVIVRAEQGLPERLLAHGPLDELTSPPNVLGDHALILTGPVPTPGFPDDRRAQGTFRWLPAAGPMPFFEDVRREEIKPTVYPEGFNWRVDDGSVFAAPKVLVSAVRSPSNPWRMRVRFDELGTIPRQSLRLVIPKPDSPATLESLGALLASAPAAMWVDQHNASRSIRQAVLASMPAPLEKRHWRRLGEFGRTLRDQVRAGKTPDRRTLLALDAFVASALGLSPASQTAIEALLAGFVGPEGRPRYEVAADETPVAPDLVRAAGAVVGIEGQRLRLWIAGITEAEGVELAIPPRFPGFLLHQGATFEALIPGGDIAAAEFRLQRQAWRSDDNLVSTH